MHWPRSSLFIIVLTFAGLVVIAFHLLPYGAPNVWLWQHRPLTEPSRIVFPAIALGILGLVIRFPLRAVWLAGVEHHVSRIAEIKALTALWAACGIMSISVALMHPLGFWHLASLIINPAANSYYTTALTNAPPAELLHNYHEKMPGFVAHAQTQSAGPVVLFSTLHRTFASLPPALEVAETLLALSPGISSEAAAQQSNRAWRTSLSPADVSISLLIALFLIAFGSLAVVPIYYLSKSLYGVTTAAIAASAWTLLPSFHSFTVSVDQMYPVLSGLILCGIFQGARCLRNSPQFPIGLLIFACSGMINGVGLFFNVGLLMVLPLALIFALSLYPITSAHKLMPGAASFMVGLLLPLLFLRLVYGFDWLAVFQTSNALNYKLHYAGARSYFVSLGSNLWDFFTFAGAPITSYFFYRLSSLHRERFATSENHAPFSLLCAAPMLWAVSGTLLLLDLSGKTRGEVARMWMLLYPAICIEASVQIRNTVLSKRFSLPLLLVLQWTWVVTVAFNVRVWGY